MVHRIQDYRPNLKKSGPTVDTSDEKPALAYDSNSDIIMFSEESWVSIILGWLKSALLLIGSALLIFFVLYVTLSVSLFFVNFVGGKPAFVARGTFLGGQPAVSDYVYTSGTTDASDDPLSRLQYAFLGVPDAEIVQVASGPSDTVAVNDGNIKVTGENNATYKGTFVDDKGKSASLNDKLSDSYLVMCVSGSCEKGTFHLMSKDRIYGEVQNIKESK